ncbi:MAG: phenylalanine--tRNA ligase subunit alpha [Candidatus Nanoarchaeia archaeon]|nr:phenylalanine--tRNA ligase subunit alpha [Candidatus Nanoarchaeia archaeon]
MDNITKITKSLSEDEKLVLKNFKTNQSYEIKDLIGDENQAKVQRAILWLSNKNLVTSEKSSFFQINLDENGVIFNKNGLPEENFLKFIKEKSLTKEELINKGLNQQEIGVSIGTLKKKGLMEMKQDGESQVFEITKNGLEYLKNDSLEYKFIKSNFPKKIEDLQPEEQFAFDNLFKRPKIVKKEEVKSNIITITDLGKEVIKNSYFDKELIGSLTKEMLQSKDYKGKDFKIYDLTSKVPSVYGGSLHPMTQVVNDVKSIFLKMGFKEMENSVWMESSFWCMDSMWIPQDHPAREVQDTFYLPYKSNLPNDKDLINKIKDVHENGGNTGSTGYGYKWDPEIAMKSLLRTHTTANSYRHFGKNKITIPGKYFYIGRVFRNETISWKNLPEFHQVEGFIIGEGLTIKHLMGAIKEFYAHMGVTKIRFKPTYNPYTEPSLEAYGYFEELGRWVELINSGIFRPESLAPYGINVPVIAWGLGLERLAMMKHSIKDIRKLIGTQTDVDFIRNYRENQ